METKPAIMKAAEEKFALACKEASALNIIDNFTAAFTAVGIVSMLRESMTNEVMDRVFMPLMNTKIGFLTDRTGRPKKNGQADPLYSREIVRDAIIDGICIGLSPTGNQINIIAEKMYPTKEGYTALLKKVGCKYFLNIGYDKGANPNYAEIPVKISYEYKGEKKEFGITATVKKGEYSSHDQLRGKAERRAKKVLYEFLTGCDFGDADETSSIVDAECEDITKKETPEQAKLRMKDGEQRKIDLP